MSRELINSTKNLNSIYELSELITSFLRLCNDELKFDEASVYYYHEEKLKIMSFLFKNNSLYQKEINLDVTGTLFEESFIKQTSLCVDNMNYLDLFKKQSYLALGFSEVITTPIKDSVKTYGSIEFKYNEYSNIKIENIEKLIDIFNIKFIDLLNYEDYYLKTNNYQKYLNKEKIIPFYNISNFIYIDKDYDDFSSQIKKQASNHIEEAKYTKDDKTYYQYISYQEGNYHGYLKEIVLSNVTLPKRNEIFHDKSQKIYDRLYLDTFLEKYNEDDKVFSIIMFKFQKNFSSEILEQLTKYFDKIFYHELGYIVVYDVVDKRKLNPIINDLNKNFNNILTLNVKVGILRYNKDYSNFKNVLDILEEITNSQNLYYTKALYKDLFNKTMTRKNARTKVNSRSFKIFTRNVVNSESVITSYLVNSEFSNFKFLDERFDLIILNEIIKRVIPLIKRDGVIYYIELKTELIKNVDILSYIETTVNKYKTVKENIGFIITGFENENDTIEFIEKAVKLNYRICTDDKIGLLQKREFSVTSMIIDIDFKLASKSYFEMLDDLYRTRFIDFLFVCRSKDDYNALKKLRHGSALLPQKSDINNKY